MRRSCSNLSECQKGGFAIGPTRRGKGTKIFAIAASCLDELPARLIGDKTFDSDGLDRKPAHEYGIEMIALNRRNRPKTQDGRPLRRY